MRLSVFGLMRVCVFVRGVVEAGCFPSSDLAEILGYECVVWCEVLVYVCSAGLFLSAEVAFCIVCGFVWCW